MIFRGKIDVHINEVICQMLSQRILRFLLVPAILTKRLEVLRIELTFNHSYRVKDTNLARDIVLGQEIGCS